MARYSGQIQWVRMEIGATKHNNQACTESTGHLVKYGWPSYIRTDNGPRFRTEFALFCTLNGIVLETSSPYYNPESNGLNEAAVKNIKKYYISLQAERGDLTSSHISLE